MSERSERYKQLLAEKEKLENQLAIMKNRIQQKENSENYRKRKARTRSLIQKGALLEKYFNLTEYSVEDTEKILAFFAPYVSKHMPDTSHQEDAPM